MTSVQCTYCGNQFGLSMDRCPHCARPGLFPNVRAAEVPEERAALQHRYDQVVQEAQARGCEDEVHHFRKALDRSRPVIARPLLEVDRLLSSDKELYATYYELIESGVRLPSGEKWDLLRAVADEALFGAARKHVRFAALSLDGAGLRNYGEFSLVLREDMIAHRASVFEENSVLFMRFHGIKMAEADSLPHGYRATWDERAKLCTAKLAGKIKPSTQADEYPGILMEQGNTSEEDRFVEVHVWGPISVRTLERVVVTRGRKGHVSRAILKKVIHELGKVGVPLEEL